VVASAPAAWARPAAGAEIPDFLSLQTGPVRVHRHGTDNELTMSVTKSGGPVSLAIELTREARRLNHPRQIHSWSFLLPRRSATFSDDLSTVAIDTGGAMKAFGRIEMTLRGGETHTSTNRCPGGKVTGTTSRRTGTLKADFHFDGNDGFFDEIDRRFLPATAKRITSNGKTCPGGGGGGCFQGLTFFASATRGPLISMSVNAFRRLPRGPATITISLTRHRGPAGISHNVQWSAPGSAFKVSPDFAVTIDGRTGRPFARGVLSYERDGPVDSFGGRCRTKTAGEVRAAGALVAEYDSPGERTFSRAEFAIVSRTVLT
jgi:hypothetical protein